MKETRKMTTVDPSSRTDWPPDPSLKTFRSGCCIFL